MKTTDNSTYHKRTPLYKRDYIKKFVKNNKDINFIFDVGCNNGMISYPLQTELNKKVLGVDLSNDLDVPKDYEFKNMNVEKSNEIIYNDCTLFLSLYHHILGNSGLKKADDVFYKLLLRTKYLIFDTGNLSEIRRNKTYWYNEQKIHFNNEKELLDHFRIEYNKIGKWDVANGKRTVVVFNNDSFDNSVNVVNEYRRMIGSNNSKYGLTLLDKISNEYDFFMDISFYELELNGKRFFAKKRYNDDEREKKEIENIVFAYEHMNSDELINFYGYSEKYGLIFEWHDNIKYVEKQTKIINGKEFNDIDVLEIDGVKKYTDFER